MSDSKITKTRQDSVLGNKIKNSLTLILLKFNFLMGSHVWMDHCKILCIKAGSFQFKKMIK